MWLSSTLRTQLQHSKNTQFSPSNIDPQPKIPLKTQTNHQIPLKIQSLDSMARITPHGGLGVGFLADPRDQKVGGRLVERKVGFLGGSGRWGGRVCAVGKREEGLKESGVGGEEYVGDQFERDELSCFRGLVLDISYRPVNVVCWKRAICLEFTEKADVLEYYDQTVSSPQGSFYIPAVLRVPHLLQVMKRRRIRCNLSRKSIFYRDNYTCQYCSSREDLTIDHILPMSRGGEWKWDNLVAACSRCNSKKGHKTVEEANMKLIKVPKAPKEYDILAIPLTNAAVRSLRMRKGVPEEWQQYLSKPAP